MKLIHKIFLVALVFSMSACQMFDLDLLDNPNKATLDDANTDNLYNNVQLNFKNFLNDMWYPTSTLSRMLCNANAYNYLSAYSPESFNTVWYRAYASLLPDMDLTIEKASNNGLGIYIGSIKVMKAYVLMAMVDMFGDVPYSEYGQGTDIIAPGNDSGSSIYAIAQGLLDEAISDINGATNTTKPSGDLIFGGTGTKWVTAANSMKLRLALTTRLVDGSAGSKIAAIVNGGDLIDQTSEDMQINFGSNRDNPNSRHWLYNTDYENGDPDFQSNYYMWLLRAEKRNEDGTVAVIDPRIRFYFYRQTDKLSDNPNDWSCHFSELPNNASRPAYYSAIDPDMPYCIAGEDGYWGRDHLNSEGVPPDGNFRTGYGLYPAGGQFDDNSFAVIKKLGTTGGLGKGIAPILLASYVDFMRAEAALTANTGEDARALLESGVKKSIEKVIGFKSLVPTTMSRTVVDRQNNSATIEELYVPDAEDIQKYVDFVLARYDAASDKLDVVMKEYFIALWGNGLEAYNMYRRTGKPNNMAPALESNPGAFIRSFLYPANNVNLNSNATQKALTVQVFWDNNPADFVY
ncbi:MAG: SusD/RagB family nutrient-binding outer membrane lipoprotein [Saprospiraceae bacterium]|nr:SusD/RagB family nutrient-binding outer membrane lipoprotein [Saprospiraceae bacterium]MCB9320899.1 SusD/RagB family nutrient-binding outer membrane lipoprotein [Lewinellaceae bacterium]